MATSRSSFSEYFTSLDNVAKTRYKSKLTYNNGVDALPDPYLLKGWQNNPHLWPSLSFGDIYTYLIDTPGIYTRESLKAFKSLEAFQFFVSGHVKPLWYHPIDDTVPYCVIKGRVIPSQRLNDKPHDAWVCLHKKEASVYCAHCTCMAGLGEVCSHVAAILFKVEAAVKFGLTQSSCTSEACQWNKAFREKINPRSVSEFKDLVMRNRKKEVMSVCYSANPGLPDKAVLEELYMVCPKAVFFSMIPKVDEDETDSATEDEDECNIPEPITSLYTEEYLQLAQDSLNAKCIELLSALKYTKEEIQELELITRNQSICPAWYEHRKGRITASTAHEVSRIKDSTSPDSLINRLMGYNQYDLSKVAAIKWGNDNEEFAREQYTLDKRQEGHENFECRLSGFLIDQERPYLGASADGISLCTCCASKTVEIKCPYKHKDIHPLEAAAKDPQFCIDTDGELKCVHPYYTQVQLQMHVNQLKEADFCVYTTKGLHVVNNIAYNEDYVVSILAKCDAFFEKHLMPEILTRKLEPGQNNEDDDSIDDENEQLFCLCSQPENGMMIECEGKTCDIGWFHYPCVGIRRKPKGKWFCSECKRVDI